MMLKQTDCTDKAGDQSSVRIDRQMWPVVYTNVCVSQFVDVCVWGPAAAALPVPANWQTREEKETGE